MELSAERLRQELRYDPESGVFTWLGRRRNTAATAAQAGSVRSDGYIEIFVVGRRYRAHRLAWLYVHGKWPEHEIDHIDGDPSNNRIRNLRDVPRQMNSQNMRRPTGIEFRAGRRLPFRVRVWTADRLVTVGSFATEQEAVAARAAAKARLHPGYVG